MSRKNIRYFAFFFPQYNRNSSLSGPKTTISVGYNSSYKHGFPTAVNLATSALFQQLTGNARAKITTSLWPFPFTQNENQVQRFGHAFSAAQTLTIAFCFMPMITISTIMAEKISMAKHQQMVSGVSPAAYWLANWIFDVIQVFFGLTICIVIVFIADKQGIFTGNAVMPLLCTLFFFAWSVVPVTYFLTFFFSSIGFAQTVIFFFYFLTGFVLNIVDWILGLVLAEDPTIRDLKQYFYRIFPPFSLGESLLKIAVRDLDIFLFQGNPNPWSMETSGENIIWMFLTGIIFFMLIVLMDACDILNWIIYVLSPVPTLCSETLDEDVKAEMERLNSKRKSDRYIIEVKGLEKVYGIRCLGTPLTAVKGIWFGVKKGEIFGFLGTNGAGKTTTLEMLTGVHKPTNGKATICGISITNQLHCRRKIGFCPQFDAIFPLLSAREHLELYCSVKGITKKGIRNAMINRLIIDLGLKDYADQAASQYSGGNKRKLSCAIALVGDPEVVILDEPSSGMDPISKRFMWEFIATTMHNRSVIITTHSMEECLALCHRIGIMVGGNLRCLGTAQQLQNRFGNGYELDINIPAEKLSEVLAYFRTCGKLGSAELIESFDNDSKINLIPFRRISLFQPQLITKGKSGQDVCAAKKLSLGHMFEIVESAKEKFNIKNYTLSQTSLEQIFINLARIKDWD